jgi:Ku70/Ku80 beta-barrel domain
MPPLRTGLLSFGLVSIPVQLYTATKDQRIAFHLLHDRCGSRVQNRYYCPVCNVTVERDERVRGYEFAKDPGSHRVRVAALVESSTACGAGGACQPSHSVTQFLSPRTSPLNSHATYKYFKMSKLWPYGTGNHAIGLLPVFLRVHVLPRNNESEREALLRILFLW